MTTVKPTRTAPPMGGTELINGWLQAALPDLCSQVQIILSRPQEVTLDPTKPKILWLNDTPFDPASNCLKDAEYRKQFNAIVFVSNWQQEKYEILSNIPYAEGTLIKNAIPLLNPVLPKPRDGKLRFIYTPTPHRGLAVLAAAADQLAKQRQDWVLDVYSSFKIYGIPGKDVKFAPLYNQLRANPCVNYHGTQPNAVVRQAVLDAHVYAYPSIYMESLSIAMLEALMAGCLVITSNLGCLPEECAEWAWMMPFSENAQHMADDTYYLMNKAIDTYQDDEVQARLMMQSEYYQMFWNFENRLPLWKTLLEQVIAEGPKAPEPMFVVE